MNRKRLFALVLGSLLLAAVPADAAKLRRGRGAALTNKQKKEIRADMKSQMGWRFRLFGEKSPRVSGRFEPIGPKTVAVSGALTAVSRGKRQVEEEKAGLVRLQADGDWVWVHDRSNPYEQFKTFKDPAASVADREVRVDNAAVVRRARGKAFVLYSATDRGNELRMVTIDTRNGRPLAKSRNLARPAISAARAASRSLWRGQPHYLYLGPLAEDGRSVEVNVNWGQNRQFFRYHSTFKVDLDRNGRPTGTPVEISRRSITP